MNNLIDLIKKDRLDGGGRCTPRKGEMMMSLITKNQYKDCIEIGVWRGASLMYITEAVTKTSGHVTAIDPYNYDLIWNHIQDESIAIMVHKLIPDQLTLDRVYNELVEIINSNKLDRYVNLVRDNSRNIHHNFATDTFDFIHIDGNHDYDCVKADIINYLPKIKNGGMIVMDDTDWPGVKRAIDENLLPVSSLITEEDTWAIYMKK